MTAFRARRFTGFALLLVFAVTGAAAPARAIGQQSSTAPLTPLTVNDPAVTSGLAWNLDAINARVAWRSSLGEGVLIAVVDSGIDIAHPDLVGQIKDAVSCVGASGDASRCKGAGLDTSGHGTHVAGIVAARADDLVGTAGVAPRAMLLAVRALSAKCVGTACTATGTTADLAAGVRWALAHQADIINLSITSEQRLGPELSAAISEAWDQGSLVVLAAGNRSDEPLFFDDRKALVVTATDRAGQLSSYAPSVDAAALGLAAPGGSRGDTIDTCHVGGRPVGILSTYALKRGDGSGYACLAGTSMAAPHVSGGLALLMSMGFDRDEALERLFTTATPGRGLGGGQIDLAAAVAAPLPSGVRIRHDSLNNEIVVEEPAMAPTVGPFSVPEPKKESGPPLWLAMVAGGIGLAVVVEGGQRLLAYRRRSAGDGPSGPDDESDPDPFPPIPASPPLAAPGEGPGAQPG